jgi:hypothetical protein
VSVCSFLFCHSELILLPYHIVEWERAEQMYDRLMGNYSTDGQFGQRALALSQSPTDSAANFLGEGGALRSSGKR